MLNIQHIYSIAMTCAMIGDVAAQTYVGFADVHEMPQSRSDMTVTSYQYGSEHRMYLMGGCNTHQVCINGICSCGITNKSMYYSVNFDRYVTDVAEAPRARYRHAAIELGGVIYLFGGRDAADNVITQVDAYDINSNTWTTPCVWQAATSDLASFVLADSSGNRIGYVTGGYEADYTPSNATTVFNPQGCQFIPRAQMPFQKGDAVAIAVETENESAGFVVGGFSFDWCNGEDSVASYDPTSDTWTVRANLALGRADMALAVLNDHIFAIAGETPNADCSKAVPVTDVERLDAGNASAPYAGEWVVEQSIPSNRFRFIGATAGSTIYLFGGQGPWVDNIDGNGNGGFPVLNTTMTYSPSLLPNGASRLAAIDGVAAAVGLSMLVMLAQHL